MCGICGVIQPKNRIVSEDIIRRMCSKMQHRGPDDEGVYLKNGHLAVGLGHRRLAIIDLSTSAHQPMSNEDGSIWLVINGEIFNYKQLRKELEQKGHYFKSRTDFEVLLHLYEDLGEDCVSKLRGMFAFAIWDQRENKLILGRDRLGQKPLIYYFNGQSLCFASEFSALFASGLVEKKINYSMVDSYLAFGYIPAPRTIYEKVYKLLPGHLAIYKNNKLTFRRYWQLNYAHKLNIDEQQAVEELRRIITEAVRLRLQSDVPLGVFLSGGLDSSMVVAIMAGLGQKVKTFSIGFTEQAFNELDYARMVAQRYQTEHRELIVTPKAAEIIPLLVERYGEPYADSSAIPSYFVARETRRFVTVALNGDGGDESFAGYERYQAMYLAQAYCKIPRVLREGILNKILTRLPDSIHFHSRLRKIRRFAQGAALPYQKRYLRWMSMLKEDLRNQIYNERLKDNLRGEDTLQHLKPYLDHLGRLELLDTLLLTDISTNLPNDLLVKMDIATMANSLEGRSPFLDQEVVQFMASLPVKMKFKGLAKKYLIKKIARDYLPKKVIFRPKAGFGVPVGYWFRNELKSLVVDNLLSAKFFQRNYFKRQAIENLVKDHLQARKDYTFAIWTLLVFELWHQRFID
jgi:asparagine synthase (glutamine-hydrolysing)